MDSRAGMGTRLRLHHEKGRKVGIAERQAGSSGSRAGMDPGDAERSTDQPIAEPMPRPLDEDVRTTPRPRSPRTQRPSNQEVIGALDLLIRHVVGVAAEATDSPARGVTIEGWLTVAEAGEYLRVGEDTIRGWIASGRLPAGRCGRVTRIRRRDLDDLFVRGECTRPAGEGRPGEPPERGPGRGPEGLSARAREILAGLKGG